jgi:hypothetical protein
MRSKTLPQHVNRLIDLHHNTKIHTVAQAMAALGKKFELQEVDSLS